MKSRFLLIISLSLLFSSKIFSQQTVQINPDIKNPLSENLQTTQNLVHFGDLIDVDVVGSTEYDWRGMLTPEGFLDGLTFVDQPIFAACQSEESIAAAVAKGYEKLLRNPQVVVRIVDRSRRPAATLYGAVKAPHRFQIFRPVKLNELLILSGGITEQASGEIQILRSPNLSCSANNIAEQLSNDANQIVVKQANAAQYLSVKISDLLKGKVESNPQILSGDIITVFESKPVFVTGGVLNPKQIDARSDLSLSRAITATGGLTKSADPKKISIFRYENNETKIIEADLDKIEAGESTDVPLKPYDIIEVTEKGKNRNKYASPTRDDNESRRNSQSLPLTIID